MINQIWSKEQINAMLYLAYSFHEKSRIFVTLCCTVWNIENCKKYLKEVKKMIL